jgi:hypothetical protein
MSIAIDISSWLNNNHKVVRHATPVTMSQWISLAGMLVATVKWGAKSIKTNTPFALDILEQALTEKEKVENVIKRYNRRFNAKHKKV